MAELRAVCSGPSRFPSLEEVNKLNYLECFCFEVLRLHPSVPSDVKYAVKDCELPSGVHGERASRERARMPCGVR